MQSAMVLTETPVLIKWMMLKNCGLSLVKSLENINFNKHSLKNSSGSHLQRLRVYLFCFVSGLAKGLFYPVYLQKNKPFSCLDGKIEEKQLDIFICGKEHHENLRTSNIQEKPISTSHVNQGGENEASFRMNCVICKICACVSWSNYEHLTVSNTSGKKMHCKKNFRNPNPWKMHPFWPTPVAQQK